MNLGIVAAIVLLLVWAIGALVMQGPGWIHLLLTIGVSLLIYSIVIRSSRTSESPPKTKR
jgi:uncharacterized membrane protein